MSFTLFVAVMSSWDMVAQETSNSYGRAASVREIFAMFFSLIATIFVERSAPNAEMGITLLEKWAFEMLNIWKDIGFHYLINVTLGVYAAYNEHRRRPIPICYRTPYHSHVFVCAAYTKSRFTTAHQPIPRSST